GVFGEGGPGVLQPGAVAVPVEEAPQLQPPVVDQPLPYLLVQVAEMLVGVVEVGRVVDRDAQEVLAAVGRVVDLTALAVEDDALPVGTRQDDAEPVRVLPAHPARRNAALRALVLRVLGRGRGGRRGGRAAARPIPVVPLLQHDRGRPADDRGQRDDQRDHAPAPSAPSTPGRGGTGYTRGLHGGRSRPARSIRARTGALTCARRALGGTRCGPEAGAGAEPGAGAAGRQCGVRPCLVALRPRRGDGPRRYVRLRGVRAAA